MKASDFVARYLEVQKVESVYELVGGMITHLLDSISLRTSIRLVSCHHEQAAALLQRVRQDYPVFQVLS